MQVQAVEHFKSISTIKYALTALIWPHKHICDSKGETFQSYAVNFTVVVLYVKWVLYYQRLWPLLWEQQRLLAGSLQHPAANQLHTHSNIFSHYLIDLLAFVSKGCCCFLPSPLGTISEWRGVSFDWSRHQKSSSGRNQLWLGWCVAVTLVTWYNMKWYWTTPVWH